MNTGVQDAHALAWKIALVARGLLPASALDAYDAERAPVADALLATTDRLFRLVDRRERWAAALRTWLYPVVAKLASTVPGVRTWLARTVGQLAIRYDAGCVQPDAGDGLPAEAPRAGARWPYVRFVRDGVSISTYRLFGYGAHHVVVFAPGASLDVAGTSIPRGLTAVVRAHVVRRRASPGCLVADSETFARFAGDAGAVYLVRPDAYVALRRAGDAPATIASALAAYFPRAGAGEGRATVASSAYGDGRG